MSLDFLQVRNEVKKLGENAPLRARQLQEKKEIAVKLLSDYAGVFERLRQKVQTVVQNYDRSLRCALPTAPELRQPEQLNAHFPPTELPLRATILAADGSQINPDRHEAVNYCLINVGAITFQLGSAMPPEIRVSCQLLYDEALYTDTGILTEETLALLRDLNERTMLAELAAQAASPVITFTDGPMELWGVKESASGESQAFQRRLDEYLDVLRKLSQLGVITAGYVDKPGAGLVVRLLEVAATADEDLPGIKKSFPLRGVSDLDLFQDLLGEGERTAVFAIQSPSMKLYSGELALHFFYLNVGLPGRPWLARVEIPAWVARDAVMLENLHSVLLAQCRILGASRYPYVLHRAHEAAVVSLQEKEQVTQMILAELRRRGVPVGELSHKQFLKGLSGRTRVSV
jgi:hypothetical protein